MAVYFLQAGEGGAVKIGLAKDARRRVALLKTGSPLPLTLIGLWADGSAEDEQALHRRFAGARVRGEWFEPVGDLIDFARRFPVPEPKRHCRVVAVLPSSSPRTLVDRCIARIRAYAAHRGWSCNRLAAEAGIRESTLRGIRRVDWNPHMATLRKLEAIVPMGFSPPRQP